MDSLVHDQVVGQLQEYIRDKDVIQTIWNIIRKPQLTRSTLLQKPETINNNDGNTSLVVKMDNGNVIFSNPQFNSAFKVNSMVMSLNETYCVCHEELFILDSNWNVIKVINLRELMNHKKEMDEDNLFYVTSWENKIVVAMTDTWMDGTLQNTFGISFRSIELNGNVLLQTEQVKKYFSFRSTIDPEPEVLFFSHYVCTFRKTVTITDIINPEYQRTFEDFKYSDITGFVIHNDRIFIATNCYVYVYSATHVEKTRKIRKRSKQVSERPQQVPVFINHWKICDYNNITMAPYGDNIIVCSQNEAKAYVLTTDGKPLYEFNTHITPVKISTLNNSILIEGSISGQASFSKLLLFQ